MPRRSSWVLRDGIPLPDTHKTPVAVFFRPNSSSNASGIIGSQIVSREVEAEKIPKALTHESGRVGLVVTRNPGPDLYNYPKIVAETLFLVQALPKNVNVAVCIDISYLNISEISAVASSLSTSIIYSDIEGFDCRAYCQGAMSYDKHSVTGLFYLGDVRPEIANYAATLSMAASVVNCCYAGRGAQAGVDWQSSVIEIASEPARLHEMVDVASLGLLTLPEALPDCRLEPWESNAIFEHVMYSNFRRESGDSPRFRDLFGGRLLNGGDPEWETAARNMKVIERLWAKVPATFDEPILIEDVNPESEHVRERLEKIDETIGVRSFIEAYLAGVPLDDLFV